MGSRCGLDGVTRNISRRRVADRGRRLSVCRISQTVQDRNEVLCGLFADITMQLLLSWVEYDIRGPATNAILFS